MPGEEILLSLLKGGGGNGGGGGGGIAAPVFQTIAGIANYVKALRQEKEAKERSKNLVRPDYEIAEPIKDNQAIAETRAMQGLSDAAKEVYQNNMDRTFTTGVDAILMGGGDVNSISDLYDNAEDKFANLALLDEEMRLKNIQILQNQNQVLAGELDKQFMINKWAPYQDEKQDIARLRSDSEKNKSLALNNILGAGMNAAGGNTMKNDGKMQGGGSNFQTMSDGSSTIDGINIVGTSVNPNSPEVTNPYLHAARGVLTGMGLTSVLRRPQSTPSNSTFLGNNPYSGVSNSLDEDELYYKNLGINW
jgi:hypothetical protein